MLPQNRVDRFVKIHFQYEPVIFFTMNAMDNLISYHESI
jgi:hypothetical protein